MRRYVTDRVVSSFFVLISVLGINFIIINLAPGNPATIMGAETGLISQDYIQYLTQKWGLDKPVYERLAVYLWNVFHGDLGISYRYAEPVSQLIFERIPLTLAITVPSIVIGFLVGTLLATLACRKPGGGLDVGLTTVAMGSYSAPIFWVAILLINAFSVRLKLLPPTGLVSPQLIGSNGFDYYLDMAKHAILPIVTLTLGTFPPYYRLTKSVILEQLSEDYVVTLKAMGLPRFRVLYKHVLRNALLPGITLFGIQMGFAFAGAALVENVFAWPGIGRLMLDAIMARDYNLLMGIFLFVTLAVVVANIVVDLVYGYLDPRIRRG